MYNICNIYVKSLINIPRNLYNNLLFLQWSCELRIDTYLDQYVENNRYYKLLFLDGKGVKFSVDVYIFAG